MKGRARPVMIVTLVLALAPLGGARADASCAGPSDGGDWRLYGADLGNSRSQPAEDAIDAAAAGALAVAWHFKTSDHSGGTGAIQSTPVVADGCVYFGTTTGWVFALNAEDGGVVWATKLAVGAPGLLCTGIVGSTPVADGKVFVAVSQAGSPYLAVLDQRDGSILWDGPKTLDATDKVYNCSSPVPFNGMVFVGFNGDQTGAMNRGGFVIYDVNTGEQLVKTYTIDDDDIDTHKGGGIWATPAVDPEAAFAYVGTSNPDAGTPQHEHTDAILKIDVDRASDDFGRIVDSYAGNPDRYLDLPDPPTCNPDPTINVYVRSVLCMQMDLDFGASPQLVDTPAGQVVGALQKAGVYHAALTADMEQAWATVVAPPLFYANGSTAATDGSSIFVAGSPPGQMVSLHAEDGLYQWASPIADGLHYEGVAYANGLVYTTDAKGFLDIYDAETGVPVAHRPIHLDVGEFVSPVNASSASVSIARHTVYAAVTDNLVAYVPEGENP